MAAPATYQEFRSLWSGKTCPYGAEPVAGVVYFYEALVGQGFYFSAYDNSQSAWVQQEFRNLNGSGQFTLVNKADGFALGDIIVFAKVATDPTLNKWGGWIGWVNGLDNNSQPTGLFGQSPTQNLDGFSYRSSLTQVWKNAILGAFRYTAWGEEPVPPEPPEPPTPVSPAHNGNNFPVLWRSRFRY